MRKTVLSALCAGSMALSACVMTPTEQMVVGGLGGAALGLIAADVLNADPNWTIIAALGGAAAGTLVARNMSNNLCAYSNGDGTYYYAHC